MIRTLATSGRDDLARVYIVDFGDGLCVECAESLQPPRPVEEKWVMLVSTLFGCPVGCSMCDAGTAYRGKLSAEQIFAQIAMMIERRFPDMRVPSRQFKVQFARMGEPALNPAVIEVLESFPDKVHAPGFMPSISTVAPDGTEGFFHRLEGVKEMLYPSGQFQLQFSIHTTDPEVRRKIIPVKTWSMARIAEYGSSFRRAGDRKVTLNFALAEDSPLDPDILLEHFDPDTFLVKITPLNPTYRARDAGLRSRIESTAQGEADPVVLNLREAGYDVIVSIGHREENRIGSNCGQYLRAHMESRGRIAEGYQYEISETRP